MSSPITLYIADLALHACAKRSNRNSPSNNFRNNNKMAPVEQDPRTDQVDPCKSITLGPYSEIPDL
jgi:hypothetical protein